jgi:hypothetical protein
LQHGGAIYLIGVVFFKLDGRLPLVNNSKIWLIKTYLQIPF